MTTEHATERIVYTGVDVLQELEANPAKHAFNHVKIDNFDAIYGLAEDGLLVFVLHPEHTARLAREGLKELSGLVSQQWMSEQARAGNGELKLTQRGELWLSDLRRVLPDAVTGRQLQIWDPIAKVRRPMSGQFVSDGTLVMEVPESVRISCANAARRRISELLLIQPVP